MATRELERRLGRRIHMLRWDRRWSLLDLERITGIPQSALSRYERGISWPEADRLVVLAEAFGTTPSDLLGSGEGLKPPQLSGIEQAA